MKEDALYIKFVQDITVEILDKCLYTNKALKKIMKKHIINNIGTLDKVRAAKIQLGLHLNYNFLSKFKKKKNSRIECARKLRI